MGWVGLGPGGGEGKEGEGGEGGAGERKKKKSDILDARNEAFEILYRVYGGVVKNFFIGDWSGAEFSPKHSNLS